MSETKTHTEAEVCLEAGKKLGDKSFRLEKIEGVPYAVVAQGYELTSCEGLLPHPLRRKGSVSVDSLDSFCAFFNRYKGMYIGRTLIAIQFDPNGTLPAVFKAIFNYHSDEQTGDAGHGDFYVEYRAKPSAEWIKWMEKNGKLLAHAEFIEHLENCMELIVDPPGADLLAFLGNLTGHSNASFENAINTYNGSFNLAYKEEVEVRGAPSDTRDGKMTVPAKMTVALPPFQYGTKYRIENKLRYRVDQRKLKFQYEIVSPHLIIQDSVNIQVAKIKELTGEDPIFGTVK